MWWCVRVCRSSARGRHFALAGAKQTRRVYPNRTESASEACAPLKKGKAIFHRVGFSVCSGFTIVGPKLSLNTIRCEISRLLDRRGTSDRNGPCEAGARVSATRQRFANRRISRLATSRVAGFFLEFPRGHTETESHKSK
jgi:hypothetical protein